MPVGGAGGDEDSGLYPHGSVLDATNKLAALAVQSPSTLQAMLGPDNMKLLMADTDKTFRQLYPADVSSSMKAGQASTEYASILQDKLRMMMLTNPELAIGIMQAIGRGGR